MNELIEKLSIKYGWTTNSQTALTLPLELMQQMTLEELREYHRLMVSEFGEDGVLSFEHIPSHNGYPVYDTVED